MTGEQESEVRGALARAYTYSENENKVLDGDLLNACVEELTKLDMPAILSELKNRLDTFTDELASLMADEDLDDDKLRDAAEGLLPSLTDALHEAGFGKEFFSEEQAV